MKIIGEWLTNLRFVDDVVVLSQNVRELQVMMNELARVCLKVGLKINAIKTVILTNTKNNCEIEISGNKIKVFENITYLGQIISFKDNTEKEIAKRRKQA